MNSLDRMAELFESLDRRRRPEDIAELILGELLGNVARHTPGSIAVDFRVSAGRAFLSVTDEGPGFGEVSRALPLDPLSENGRGRFLDVAATFGPERNRVDASLAGVTLDDPDARAQIPTGTGGETLIGAAVRRGDVGVVGRERLVGVDRSQLRIG